MCFVLVSIQGCISIFDNKSEDKISNPKVVIIVIDGARYSETFGGHDHEYINNIWNELRPKGTIFTSFFIDSSGQTLTNPGHASILTGTWQNIANNGEERPSKPTLFEYFRKKKKTDIRKAHLIASKAKLKAVSYSNSAEYGEAYKASTFGAENYGDDIATINKAEDVIKNDKPDIIFMNLAATDVAGHTGNFDRYVTALNRADSLVYNFWQMVQKQDYYEGKTNLFITTDHGRHLDGVKNGFQSHGDNCLGCRKLFLLAIGPQIPSGKTVDKKYYQIDLANTVGDIMDFSLEYSEGDMIKELFK